VIRKITCVSAIFFVFLGGFFASGFAFSLAWADDPVPFWRAKPKVFAKITDERQIIVSVDAEKHGAKSVLRMDGGGLVTAPCAAAFAEAQKYQELKEVSDHVVEVRTGPAEDDLFVHTQAFNYHARMSMKVKTDTDTAGIKHLRFTVVEGNFKGMTGDFNFAAYDKQNQTKKTVLGFHAEYEYDVLPMPQFFVEFGLEVVLQRVASEMRSFLEKKLKP